MDNWQALGNWALFGTVAALLGGYYITTSNRGQAQNRRRSVQEAAPRNKRSELLEDGASDRKKTGPAAGSATAKKPKAPKKEDTRPAPAPAVVVDPDDQAEREEMSNKAFAESMAQARKGKILTAPTNKRQQVRTVKQGSAKDTAHPSSSSSQAGAEADDDVSTATSPALNAGDVSDMLEPVAKGPTTLRVTAPSQPQKEKVVRQSKEVVEETKKQRQNRAKKEQQRVQREQEERERKALEEKTRRAAREARGEPAKNGIPVSKPPANSAWTAPKSGQPAANGPENGPLLDTFDAESTASSNGGPSTAATSTTEPETQRERERERDHDQLSEEEQVAMAMKQSQDESGWTTVAVPKKQQKKKVSEISGNSTPVESTKAQVPNGKLVTNGKPVTIGKPNGYTALNDHADVSDPLAWTA